MGNKERAGKLLLAVATAGLTTCSGGSVDPAPEPLVCEDVGKGEGITITGTLLNGDLSMKMETPSYDWVDVPTVTAVSGLTIGNVSESAGSTIDISATLDAGATVAKFTVQGKGTDGEVTCDVSRTFTVTVTGDNVEIAEQLSLPLSPRRHASIEMLGRDGLQVDLRASGTGYGTRVTWTPTAGAVKTTRDGRARWSLPLEPGVYQVEMLVDRGDDGFSVDTLTLEVLG